MQLSSSLDDLGDKLSFVTTGSLKLSDHTEQLQSNQLREDCASSFLPLNTQLSRLQLEQQATLQTNYLYIL